MGGAGAATVSVLPRRTQGGNANVVFALCLAGFCASSVGGGIQRGDMSAARLSV